MAEHRNLTGASLHEPKGVETATAGEVYVADGSGSGVWSDLLSGVNNLNAFDYTGTIDDISTASSSAFFYVNQPANLVRVSAVLYGAITGTDAVLSILKNGVAQGQTLTVPIAGSTAGAKSTLLLAPQYSFVAGDVLEIKSDGASTGVAKTQVSVLFSAT